MCFVRSVFRVRLPLRIDRGVGELLQTQFPVVHRGYALLSVGGSASSPVQSGSPGLHQRWTDGVGDKRSTSPFGFPETGMELHNPRRELGLVLVRPGVIESAAAVVAAEEDYGAGRSVVRH
jgi:hypothetical protein